MPEFRKYMHVERFGNDEVQGIELGDVYIFPKLDGTNASVWRECAKVYSGSRNRELSEEKDNAGFCKWVNSNEKFTRFLADNSTLILYGEWLVPHSLKTYQDAAWRKFYVFDVWDWKENRYLSYEEYQPLMDEYGIDYIPCITILKNGTYETFLKQLELNQYLIKDGEGSGEGIVLKNYKYQNKYRRTCWAKMITNSFKEKHVKIMGPQVRVQKRMVEEEIVNKYVDKPLVDKVYSKITNENSGWNSRYIPRLLNEVYHDLVVEEIWDAIKKMKNPIINFKTLQTLVTMKIKELKHEVF
jgi:hypothetical protein